MNVHVRRLAAALCFIAIGWPAAADNSKRAAACGTSATNDVRFTRDIQPIFNANCVSCHQNGSAMQGLILEEGLSYKNTFARKSNESALALVMASDPLSSYLFHKISGTQKKAGGSGERMPLGGQLDGQSITAICQWISKGALND